MATKADLRFGPPLEVLLFPDEVSEVGHSKGHSETHGFGVLSGFVRYKLFDM